MKVKNFRNIMPNFNNINDTIFYNQKKHFFNILEKPVDFFTDIHCISKIEEEWKQFNSHIQKLITKEYKEDNELNILSSLLLDKTINSYPCAVELLNFLLSKDFEFSKKDIEVLQQYHWLPLKNSQVKCNAIKQCFMYVFSWIKKLRLKSKRTSMEQEPVSILVEKIPPQMHNVLQQHASKLPKSLQEKLLYEMENFSNLENELRLEN